MNAKVTHHDLVRARSSPQAFRELLRIDADGRSVSLEATLDAWQRTDFAAMDAAWMRCVCIPAPESPSRAWLERPRGHSKTNDAAVMTTWALFAAARPIAGVAAAADRDQARLLVEAIRRLSQLNPWLAEVVEVGAFRITNRHTGSTLDALSADAGSSYGILPSFVIADEVTHWPRRELLDSLLSAAGKRASCLFLAISNAGFRSHFSWQFREAVQADTNWYFRSLAGPQASWITAAVLAEQERLLPAMAFARLWNNVWVDGSGDALDAADIEAAILRPAHAHSPPPGPHAVAQPGFSYLAGLDLGIKSDHSALVVLGIDSAEQRVRLASCESWTPPRGGQVDLSTVEAAVLDAHRRFGLRGCVFDPYQAALMAQRLHRAGVSMVEQPFAGASLNRMATCLMNVFRDRQIDLYRHAGLLRDLARLSIVEKSYGFKLESVRDASGHADMATALAIVLPHALEQMKWGPRKEAVVVDLIPFASQVMNHRLWI